MSQKKVDEYKNYKKNRRENIKKEKRKERLTMAAMWGAVVVFIACVGGAMGVSIYNKYQAKRRHFQLTVPQVLFFLIWQAFRKKIQKIRHKARPKMLHLLSLLSLKVHLMKQQLLRKHQIRRHSPRQKTKRQSRECRKINTKKGFACICEAFLLFT